MQNDTLIQRVREKFDHESARRNLREKYQAKLIFAHDGGMWRADPNVMAFLGQCDQEYIVMPDLYDNPIRVKVDQLHYEMQMRWQEQMNAWLAEYQELNRRR